jgi:lipopolysaccharide biosynthesis protein
MSLKPIVKKILGQRICHQAQVGIETLDRDWTFKRSAADGVTRLVRLKLKRRTAPAWRAIRSITAQPRWIIYFIYLPDGKLTLAHQFTLKRLKEADAGLAVICATNTPGVVPSELHNEVDALYWKDLPGFDFSAYSIGLREIAKYSAGADVLVLNDSVFGPFVPIDRIWAAMYWDLTGFTASGQIQNHIQSYAFHLRDWNADKLRALRRIFPKYTAYDSYRDAVYGQESKFADAACHAMSVGSLWYADHIRCNDPTIFAALPLIEAGFPFLKRSLLTRNAQFVDTDAVIKTLRRLGHPVDGIKA